LLKVVCGISASGSGYSCVLVWQQTKPWLVFLEFDGGEDLDQYHKLMNMQISWRKVINGKGRTCNKEVHMRKVCWIRKGGKKTRKYIDSYNKWSPPLEKLYMQIYSYWVLGKVVLRGWCLRKMLQDGVLSLREARGMGSRFVFYIQLNFLYVLVFNFLHYRGDTLRNKWSQRGKTCYLYIYTS